MQEVIRELKNGPPILNNKDLIRLGLYRSTSALVGARWRGIGPPSFRLGPRTTRYDREEVIEWLRKQVQINLPETSSEGTNTNTEE